MMTIPTRPAPAPPGSRAQNAAAGANASLEQLRLQLQQQQQLQKQQFNGGSIPKLTINLPPPLPKEGPHAISSMNNNNNNSGSGSNITRKFPQARYSSTSTSWDDELATVFAATNTNGNFKKMPPPRPPPPKVQKNAPSNNTTSHSSTSHSTNILTTIFNRKKSSKSTSSSSASSSMKSNNSASRIYGVSSGNNSNNSNFNSSSTQRTTSLSYGSNSSLGSSGGNWNANWASTNYSMSTITNTRSSNSQTHEAQLISFDSPPSSPTFTQKSNSDCVSVDSFSSDSNFSSPNNGSVSQPESGFEDDFSAARSRPQTTSPLDPWETFDAFGTDATTNTYSTTPSIGTAPVRNLNCISARMQSGVVDNPLCNGKSLLPPAPSLTAPTIIKPKIAQKPKAPKPPVLHKQSQSASAASVFGTDLPTPPSPPMPQCPPPPPPSGVSLLDVISGKADAMQLSCGNNAFADESSNQQPYGISLYDFDGVEEDDLSFRENEKIYLLEQVSDEWYRGRTRAGCEGIFPINYIEIKVPLVETSNTSSSASSATTPTYQQANNTFTMQSTMQPIVRCLYNFPAEVDGDLALKENDLVTILYRINEDWLYGEIDGRQGQFPANFLEYIPDNIPMP